MPKYIVVAPGHIALFEQYEAALSFTTDFDGVVLNVWGLPRPTEHHWISYVGRGSGSSAVICCQYCGIVRRADGRYTPCKGIVSVGLRSKAFTTS